MRELFIYYRVSATRSAEALVTVQRYQRELRARYPGLSARLLRRPAQAGGAQTWMETYALDGALDGQGVGVELQVEIEASARSVLPMLDGPRHLEAFIVV